MEWKRDAYRIVDDASAPDVESVFRLLAATHWASRRPREVVEKLIENSLCFSLTSSEEQIGFARVVTDFTVFSWLSDLVIADAHRGQGLGEWMLACVIGHPAIAHTQFLLQTSDAHGLYQRHGFEGSAKLMTRLPPPSS